jgi:hypothetical protein
MTSIIVDFGPRHTGPIGAEQWRRKCIFVNTHHHLYLDGTFSELSSCYWDPAVHGCSNFCSKVCLICTQGHPSTLPS